MLYCDIKTLINICVSCKTLMSICDKSFWFEKFAYDDLLLINSKENLADWICEYIISKNAKQGLHNILTFNRNYIINNARRTAIILKNFISHKYVEFVLYDTDILKPKNRINYHSHQLLIIIYDLRILDILFASGDLATPTYHYMGSSSDLDHEQLIMIIMKTFYVNYQLDRQCDPQTFINIRDIACGKIVY